MYKKLFIISAFFFLMGAGCASSTPVAVSEPVDTTPVIKKPETIANPRTEAAEKYCEKNGNNIVFQFDSIKKQQRAFCVFANNAACDAELYLDGQCGPNSGAKIFAASPTDTASLVRECSSDDTVVCGTDGKNYTNRCVAEMQHIAVLHDGLCTAEEQTQIEPSSAKKEQTADATVVIVDANGKPTKSTSAIAQDASQWLAMLYQTILSRGPQKPRASVSSCTAPGDVTYLYKDGSFSALYNEDGTVRCFPSNDIADACPVYLKDAASLCTQIWKDGR